LKRRHRHRGSGFIACAQSRKIGGKRIGIFFTECSGADFFGGGKRDEAGGFCDRAEHNDIDAGMCFDCKFLCRKCVKRAASGPCRKSAQSVGSVARRIRCVEHDHGIARAAFQYTFVRQERFMKNAEQMGTDYRRVDTDLLFWFAIADESFHGSPGLFRAVA